MTKYILHGGNTTIKNDLNRQFFAEIVKDLPEGATVLLVYFARKEEEYERLRDQDIGNFTEHSGRNDLVFDVSEKESFIDQVKKAGAVYIRGGEPIQLIETLKKYPDFTEIIKTKKVVAGSSAGAYALSMYANSSTKKKTLRGLGIIPVRTFAHFDGDQSIIDELNKYPNDLELILLRDYEYTIIMQ